MAKHVIIDLGTSNIKITEAGKGEIFSAPSVVAIDNKTGRVVAVGADAKNLLGRAPADISVISPVRNGVIADFEVASAMLKVFLNSVFPKGTLRPRAEIIVPIRVTDMEKRAITEAASRAGVKVLKITESPLSSAQSAQIDISQPYGNMILDIGAGLVSAAVISFGGIVCGAVSSDAGNEMDKNIKDYIKKNFGVSIGEKTAEEIKCAIGSAHPSSDSGEFTLLGRCISSGLPKEITVSSEEIRHAISPTLMGILDVIKAALENAPPELACDLKERGITITGGGANLLGLSQFIQENIGLQAHGVTS